MIKKVILISYQPLTSKVYSDYYLNTCINNGLNVEYWDISNIYLPNIKFRDSFEFIYIKKINSLNELKCLLSNVDMESTIFITNITYEFKVLSLFKILSHFNCKLIVFGRGMFPSPNTKKVLKLIDILLSFDTSRIYTAMRNRIAILFKRFRIVKPYTLIFMSGSEGYNTLGCGNQLDIVNSKIISVNYFDYDKYIETRWLTPIIDFNYCVFLDEYLPYHPDFQILGIKTVPADIYYSQINNFFDFIERKFNIRIIIAVDPKAQKYKTVNPFSGRSIFFNKTCELVKDATFVMTHYSSSISFPVLFKKPILFLTSNLQKLEMPHSHALILHIGNYLNCEVLHFDSDCEWSEFKLNVDIEKYDEYKYKYLTSKESENRQSSDIFIDAILQI